MRLDCCSKFVGKTYFYLQIQIDVEICSNLVNVSNSAIHKMPPHPTHTRSFSLHGITFQQRVRKRQQPELRKWWMFTHLSTMSTSLIHRVQHGDNYRPPHTHTVLTDRPTTRLHAPPGGTSSVMLGNTTEMIDTHPNRKKRVPVVPSMHQSQVCVNL